MLSNYEIRKKARETLGGKLFKGEWLYPILFTFILSAISSALGFTLIGTILLYGVLSLASAGYFLQRVRGQVSPSKFDAAIDSVKKDFAGSMITGILAYIFIVLGILFFYFPGLILSCQYSMVYYIRLDNPNLGAWESLKKSSKLISGNRMKYFKLQLSFVGWILLSFLTLGISMLWVAPYMNTANAIFYEELLADSKNRSEKERNHTLGAWFKERIRKFFVVLQKNPQAIPIASLSAAFIHYSLNLTHISDTTAKLQGQNMGLAAFITMLFLILSFVCMLSAFPKRQKPKISLIIVMVLLYGAVVFADVHYMLCIVNALYRPVDPIAPSEYIYTAYNTVLINIILVAVTVILVLTEPLYAKLIKKIKTSIEVEGSGDIEAIDISDED